MTYNGWSNRATWLVNMWFNPNSKNEVEEIHDHFYERIRAIKEPWLRDFVDTSVDWQELKDNCDEGDE